MCASPDTITKLTIGTFYTCEINRFCILSRARVLYTFILSRLFIIKFALFLSTLETIRCIYIARGTAVGTWITRKCGVVLKLTCWALWNAFFCWRLQKVITPRYKTAWCAFNRSWCTCCAINVTFITRFHSLWGIITCWTWTKTRSQSIL